MPDPFHFSGVPALTARKLLGVVVFLLCGCSQPSGPNLQDTWSPAFTFRDTASGSVRLIRPPGGWQMSPLHGHVLPNGKVLLNGEEKEGNENRAGGLVLFNDASWVIDPADPRFQVGHDADIAVDVRFPPAVSEENPHGTLWRFDAVDGEAFEALECGGHTFLADGRLFIAGGGAKVPDDDPLRPPEPKADGLVGVGISKAAAWNFEGDAGWSSLPPMTHGPRWYPTATRLPDGKVLLSSGYYDTERLPNPSVELFDPSDESWTVLLDAPLPGDPIPASDPRSLMYSHVDDYLHVFLLPKPARLPTDAPVARELAMVGLTGQVLFFSVSEGDGVERLYVPPNGRRPAADSIRDRMFGATSTLLPDGRLLVAGGLGELGQSVDIYDPRPESTGFDTWRSFEMCDAAGTCVSRHHGSSVLLPDGRVAVVAGHGVVNDAGDQRRAAFIDWRNETVQFGSPWPDEFVRGYHNVVLLLPDARLLVVGGRNNTWTTCNGPGSSYCLDERTEMRFYSPAYLASDLLPLRPNIDEPLLEDDGATALPMDRGNPVIGYGERFTVGVTVAGDDPALEVALLGLGTMTHSFDMNQRHVALESTRVDGGLQVRAPADGTVAPPGPYMLFVLRAASEETGQLAVPSEARIVWLR